MNRVLTNVGILRNKGLDSLRRIIESDNNEDTLWLCTRDDDDRESVTLTEKTGNVEQEETFWRFKKKEGTKSCVLPEAEASPAGLSGEEGLG